MGDFVILQKPKFGEPCNRCGQCCKEQLCEIGHEVFGGESERMCPALELDGAQFACGLIRRPDFYIVPHWSEEDRKRAHEYFSPKMRAVLGIGQGCGMPDVGSGLNT